MSSISVSIVSHSHGDLLLRLLNQLNRHAQNVSKVIVTLNVPENIHIDAKSYSFELIVIRNKQPKGFAANHNEAFIHCNTEYYCILNPDIQIHADPFLYLVDCLKEKSYGIAAPAVINSKGEREDSARKFPTPLMIFKKALADEKGIYPVLDDQSVTFPDWVAGMFLLFPSRVFNDLAGFDEGYFLYYEDVDICLRAWREGYPVMYCSAVTVIHDAQRDSHKDMQFLLWHLKSLGLFFIKHLGRFPRRSR